uniref:Teratocyte protein III n=1 Tax=Cotesia flavipes TaxID=89805 RepID=A0A8K1YTU3_COTFL|nr:teratocyte protein III [Cotesia flavipes]
MAKYCVFFACFVLFACSSANPVGNLKAVLGAATQKCGYSRTELNEKSYVSAPNSTNGFGNVEMVCFFSELGFVQKNENNAYYLNGKVMQDVFRQVVSKAKPSASDNLEVTAAVNIVKNCSQEKADNPKKLVENFVTCFDERKAAALASATPSAADVTASN